MFMAYKWCYRNWADVENVLLNSVLYDCEIEYLIMVWHIFDTIDVIFLPYQN